MLPLGQLAFRYLIWVVVLRILYTLLINVAGVPASQATFVILAAVPAMDIGMQMVKKATRTLLFADWATAWGVMISVYLVLNVIIPAILIQQFRAALSNPEGLQSTVAIIAATAAMLALFLWIGKRSARSPNA